MESCSLLFLLCLKGRILEPSCLIVRKTRELSPVSAGPVILRAGLNPPHLILLFMSLHKFSFKVGGLHELTEQFLE